jgi:hypothetical protein
MLQTNSLADNAPYGTVMNTFNSAISSLPELNRNTLQFIAKFLYYVSTLEESNKVHFL